MRETIDQAVPANPGQAFSEGDRALASPAVLERIPQPWPIQTADLRWHRDPSLRESLRACRATTRHHAKSFYFASFHLPGFRRAAAFAVYSFCRTVDDAIDNPPNGESPDRAFLETQLDRILGGENPEPFAPAFRATVEQFGIPRTVLSQLIEGCCRDREPVAFSRFDQLEEYCYYVASVVGLMMCPVFGLRDTAALPLAVDLGIAMQLTNILRDVRQDHEMGRLYLPSEELERDGISLEAELAAPSPSATWRTFVQQQIHRTRAYYASGLRGLSALSPDGSAQAVRTMAVVYRGILDAIEKASWDNLSTRRYVPFSQKVRLALAARIKR